MGASCPILGQGRGYICPRDACSVPSGGGAHNDPHIISERVSREFGCVGAAAQQLVQKPGFTEKRERVVCGRMGCEPKTFYARPGCRRVQTGGFVGLPGACKVVCGGQ